MNISNIVCRNSAASVCLPLKYFKFCYATNAKPATDKSSDVFANESNVTTKSDEKDLSELNLMPTIPEAEENMEREESFRRMVEKMRDVSRLRTKRAAESHYKRMPTITNRDDKKLKDVDFYRKLYAKFGKESNIDPGLAWPTEQALNNMIDLETRRELSFKQKVDIIVQQKKAEIEAREKRVKETDDALKKMPKQIEDFYQRIVRKTKAEEDKKKKQQDLLNLARDHFGYEVDLRDSKVQEVIKKLQADKEAASKKTKK